VGRRPAEQDPATATVVAGELPPPRPALRPPSPELPRLRPSSPQPSAKATSWPCTEFEAGHPGRPHLGRPGRVGRAHRSRRRRRRNQPPHGLAG
jgi:hypothetical protein